MSMDRPDPGAEQAPRPEQLTKEEIKLSEAAHEALAKNGIGDRIAQALAQKTEGVEWVATVSVHELSPTSDATVARPDLSEPGLLMAYRADGGDWKWTEMQVVGGIHTEHPAISVISLGQVEGLSATPDEIRELRDDLSDAAYWNRDAALAVEVEQPWRLNSGEGYRAFVEGVTPEDIDKAPVRYIDDGKVEPKEITAARVLEQQYFFDQLHEAVNRDAETQK